MTIFLRLLALAGLINCTSSTTAKDFSLAGEGRDPGVKRWVRYEIVGPRNHPLPILYLTMQPFKTMSDELLVVLPPAKYGIISATTRQRIARSDCTGEKPRADLWYTVAISEHQKSKTQKCVLPQDLACEYLSGIVRLTNINWSAQELQPITEFISEVRCNAGNNLDNRR